MRINKITLTNFSQYLGSNSIDLRTTGEKNRILIGCKNGYVKTNFLMSLVWCLYGEDIAKIDENFKREIQKEGNYSKFLNRHPVKFAFTISHILSAGVNSGQ